MIGEIINKVLSKNGKTLVQRNVDSSRQAAGQRNNNILQMLGKINDLVCRLFFYFVSK